jgi:hypothetical protein
LSQKYLVSTNVLVNNKWSKFISWGIWANYLLAARYNVLV